jgi:hypothetical protein
MNWAALIPVLIGMGTGSSVGGVSAGDPVMAGGGILSILLGFGIAYMQTKQPKPKKRK